MADAVYGISGGRLILGLGAGYHEPEFAAFGYPFDHLVAIDLPGFTPPNPARDWVRRFRIAPAPSFAGSVEAIADHLRALAAAGVCHAMIWPDPLSV